MPVERDVDERVWCPGPWPWEWFDRCTKRVHKWCYSFSWVNKTAYVAGVYNEGCEAGKLYTWWEFGFGIGWLGTFVPLGEMCFDSPRNPGGVCDGSNTGLAASWLKAEEQQAGWRYCRKCHAMFFDGYPDKGACPHDNLIFTVVNDLAGLPQVGQDLVIAALVGAHVHVRVFDSDGIKICDKSERELAQSDALTRLKQMLSNADDRFEHAAGRETGALEDVAAIVGERVLQSRGHAAQGYNFSLPHDVPPSTWAQKDWRYCHKCHVMYFDGYPDKGACAAGGGHEASGFNFVLPHDVDRSEHAQERWRYCHKCHAIFYNGYAHKGSCAAGGVHAAAGYNFVLPHS